MKTTSAWRASVGVLLCAALAAVAQTPGSGTQRVSSPGKYGGYSQKLYDGYQLTSQYVAVRDGTRLAVDIFRPTSNGKTIETKLPVLWMHTPYHRRNYRNGLTAANYPGKALELLPFRSVGAV